ncbi:NmrA family NAD(P)-binding protein [Flammeovirga kamogawensis]|uniref:NmrA family NAD(P)-binding protein n=1 Tax=Flammeovirga kamogawensis TaxID=373891 RepID=A0ABX8H0X0_9BACT|nr:NmrA family NAD(P)-binding protein [Flammeovirga kamogawensis]MBB6462424.1 uncharacterized protein YbjT (DUF2867 family) [Flammeovirga kamogawensis]QWG09535.1 NmrA family NAD(P)-binding protein [Flammeovirga kamogawensis]TRX65051.1 NAD-dependent epimerase/dehydratase family protein [Flammeovirga kamogawensis]
MYLVIGSTGNTGKYVANELLDKGQEVRVIGRDQNKLQDFISRGADFKIGDLYDKEFVEEIFEDIEAAYIVTPPKYDVENLLDHQNKIGENLFNGLQKNKVPYAVNLSSYKYTDMENAGPAKGIHLQEERLNKLTNTKVLHIRAAFFLENLLSNINSIKFNNIGMSMLDPEKSIAMVATQDVSELAVKHLINKGFEHRDITYILGNHDVNMKTAINSFANAVGREGIPYVQLSYNNGKEGLISMGFSQDMANAFVNMSRAINENQSIIPPRLLENTSKTSIDSFAKEVFAPLYNN